MAQSVVLQLLLEIKQYQTALAQAAADMNRAAQQISSHAERSARRLDAARKKAHGFASAIDFIKKRIIGAGLFFAGFYQGLILFRQFTGDVIGELFNLDEALRRVQSITKDSDEEVTKLRDRLLSLAQSGETFGQKASEMADAMFDIVQSGFTSGEALEIARTAALGAEAGFTQADTAGRVLVGVLNALGGEAEDSKAIMDVLFKTVDVGVITFEELANSLGRALGPAASLGVDLEELGAIISVLTRRGLKGREAVTSLTRIMINFLKPSDKARRAAADFGFALNASTVESHGLIGSLLMLNERLGGSNEALAQVFDRQRAVIGAQLLLTDGGAELTELYEEMGLATAGVGAATEAYNERAKALNFQLKQLGVQIVALTTRALRPMGDALARILPFFSDLIGGRGPIIGFFKENTEAAEALRGVLVSIAVIAAGKLAVAIGTSLVQALMAARAGMASFLATTGPFLILATAITAAFAAFEASERRQTTKIFDNIRGRVEKLREEFEALDRQVERGVLSEQAADSIKLNRSLEEIIGLSEDMNEGFKNFDQILRDMDFMNRGFVELGRKGTSLIRGIKSGFTDWRDDVQVLRDEWKNSVMEMIDTADLGADELLILGEALLKNKQRAQELGDTDLANFYGEAISKIVQMQSELVRTEEEQMDVAEAQGLTTRKVEDTIENMDTILERVDSWERGLKRVDDVLAGILDLTTVEQQMRNVAVAELESQIASIDVDLAKVNQKLAATGLTEEEIEESTNATVVALRNQRYELEGRKSALEAELEIHEAELDKIRANREARAEEIKLNQLLRDVQEGVALETEDQVRLAQDLVDKVAEGPGALANWIEDLDTIGIRLEDPLLSTIEDIVENMDDNELKIEVQEALTNVREVQSEIDSIGTRIMSLPSRDLIVVEERGRRGRFGFQHGVRNFVGGLALVGEAGPEIVRLPRGSDVVPTPNITRAVREGMERRGRSLPPVNVQANITTSLMKDWDELKRLALREVEKHLDEAAARANLTRPRFGTHGAGVPRI